MPRRTPPHILRALGPLALALSVASCSGSVGQDRPDVLLISLDSVRADFLDFADPETAPHLHELAQRGMVFTEAVSGTSWTLPSHAQMFTGMPPALHCLQEGDLTLDPMIPVLPELLSEAGYQTAGFYTCWYLAKEYGFGRGFDHYRNSMRGGEHLEKALADAVAEDSEMGDKRLEFRRWSGLEVFVSSPTVAENATAALAQMEEDEPAFVFAHFFDPHYDYIPPQPYDTKFDPDYTGSMTGKGFWDNPAIWDQRKDPRRQISDRDLDHIRALYRGEIAWTDRNIGLLLDALRERGRLDDTLIIVTADHGEEFFEHGNRGHRQNLFDETLRVPLLIVPPGGLSSPERRDEQVSLSDLLPTVLDYVGVETRATWHGRTLRPALEGQTLPTRALVATLVVPLVEQDRSTGRAMWDALRTPEEKLIRLWAQTEGSGKPTLRTFLYYDLQEDPGEERPVRKMSDPRVRRMWKALEHELDVIRLKHRTSPRTPPGELMTQVYEIVSDDLAHLGYAGLEGQEGDVDPAQRLGATPIPPSRIGADPNRRGKAPAEAE